MRRPYYLFEMAPVLRLMLVSNLYKAQRGLLTKGQLLDAMAFDQRYGALC